MKYSGKIWWNIFFIVMLGCSFDVLQGMSPVYNNGYRVGTKSKYTPLTHQSKTQNTASHGITPNENIRRAEQSAYSNHRNDVALSGNQLAPRVGWPIRTFGKSTARAKQPAAGHVSSNSLNITLGKPLGTTLKSTTGQFVVTPKNKQSAESVELLSDGPYVGSMFNEPEYTSQQKPMRMAPGGQGRTPVDKYMIPKEKGTVDPDENFTDSWGGPTEDARAPKQQAPSDAVIEKALRGNQSTLLTTTQSVGVGKNKQPAQPVEPQADETYFGSNFDEPEYIPQQKPMNQLVVYQGNKLPQVRMGDASSQYVLAADLPALNLSGSVASKNPLPLVEYIAPGSKKKLSLSLDSIEGYDSKKLKKNKIEKEDSSTDDLLRELEGEFSGLSQELDGIVAANKKPVSQSDLKKRLDVMDDFDTRKELLADKAKLIGNPFSQSRAEQKAQETLAGLKKQSTDDLLSELGNDTNNFLSNVDSYINENWSDSSTNKVIASTQSKKIQEPNASISNNVSGRRQNTNQVEMDDFFDGLTYSDGEYADFSFELADPSTQLMPVGLERSIQNFDRKSLRSASKNMPSDLQNSTKNSGQILLNSEKGLSSLTDSQMKSFIQKGIEFVDAMPYSQYVDLKNKVSTAGRKNQTLTVEVSPGNSVKFSPDKVQVLDTILQSKNNQKFVDAYTKDRNVVAQANNQPLAIQGQAKKIVTGLKNELDDENHFGSLFDEPEYTPRVTAPVDSQLAQKMSSELQKFTETSKGQSQKPANQEVVHQRNNQSAALNNLTTLGDARRNAPVRTTRNREPVDPYFNSPFDTQKTNSSSVRAKIQDSPLPLLDSSSRLLQRPSSLRRKNVAAPLDTVPSSPVQVTFDFDAPGNQPAGEKKSFGLKRFNGKKSSVVVNKRVVPSRPVVEIPAAEVADLNAAIARGKGSRLARLREWFSRVIIAPIKKRLDWKSNKISPEEKKVVDQVIEAAAVEIKANGQLSKSTAEFLAGGMQIYFEGASENQKLNSQPLSSM